MTASSSDNIKSGGISLAIIKLTENNVIAAREDIKIALLSLIRTIDEGGGDAQNADELKGLIDSLTPLSPIADPINHLSALSGSWTNLYAKFGAGRSQGKSNHDDSTLGLQSFRAFPDIAVHITGIDQEIGIVPNAYNNVVFFETMGDRLAGTIIVHGTYEPDDADPKRFNITFYAAEIQPRDAETGMELRHALGMGADEPLKRDFKPAKFYSDVVYLDETTRVNFGGMGGVYVLERRPGPALSL
jgi:hypothetical protein